MKEAQGAGLDSGTAEAVLLGGLDEDDEGWLCVTDKSLSRAFEETARADLRVGLAGRMTGWSTAAGSMMAARRAPPSRMPRRGRARRKPCWWSSMSLPRTSTISGTWITGALMVRCSTSAEGDRASAESSLSLVIDVS